MRRLANRFALRIALKLFWCLLLVFLLVVFSRTEYDFVYRAF